MRGKGGNQGGREEEGWGRDLRVERGQGMGEERGKGRGWGQSGVGARLVCFWGGGWELRGTEVGGMRRVGKGWGGGWAGLGIRAVGRVTRSLGGLVVLGGLGRNCLKAPLYQEWEN